MSQNFDLIVIGSGPAGYVGAIRAAQLGMKVAIIEKYSTLGGTCLNVGCIPSKALLDSSEKYEEANHSFTDHGIEVSKVKLNLGKMIERKQSVVDKLTSGVKMLMDKNKITSIQGWAEFVAEKEIKVTDEKGKSETYTAKNIMIAVGSKPIELPHIKFDKKQIVSSTEALSFSEVPKNLVVIGAGVIGLELGSVWRRLGSNVTVVDIADLPLSIMDKDLAKEAKKVFTEEGINFELKQKVVEAKQTAKTVSLKLEDDKGATKEIKADKVLVCVGRRPYTEALGLDKAGIKVNNRGQIEIDDNFETNIDGVYAVGDCVRGPMLAHKGEEEAVACAEIIYGESAHINYNAIPNVVYTWPELASVGLTEQECKEQGYEVKVGKFHYRANGRALAVNEPNGFVKIIADKKTDRMLGMHIIGANASEMISEGVMATEFRASAEDIARSSHAHPTLSEVMKEAALAVDKRALHS